METKWVCSVCGYIYEGAEPPAECPVCHAPASAFKKLEGEQTLAAEHEYGIYAKTVKDNEAISNEDKKFILDQLKANFNGECSEVGMYLCMARIAHREGYPEIGLYWEKAAFEEAEHAAKFAELLGEELEPNMKASTKENLAWRVECEFGACNGKTELATCAKKNGLDAIHDTVHEMARDEGSSRPRPEGPWLRPLLQAKPKARRKTIEHNAPHSLHRSNAGAFSIRGSRRKPWRKKAQAQKRATLKNKNPWSRFTALTKELPGAMPFAPFCAT